MKIYVEITNKFINNISVYFIILKFLFNLIKTKIILFMLILLYLFYLFHVFFNLKIFRVKSVNSFKLKTIEGVLFELKN